MSDTLQRVNEHIAPIIVAMGYEIVEAAFKRVHGDMNLTFYIYKKGGVTLDDCERVSRALEQPLDEFDITDGAPYILNVSSPGLDRPIVTDDDLRRSLGTEIEVDLRERIGRKSKLAGTLVSYDADRVAIMHNDAETEILRSNIKLARPYIKF